MFALAIKLMLVLAVMFGGTGVTAAAAQGSLPNETLYPIKMLIEDAQLGAASTPDARFDAELDHAQQRVREMAQLVDRGAAIPADVPVRLQTQLQAALQTAAQLGDQQMQAALDRLQLRTQDPLREMDRLHLTEAAQALTQAREMAQLGQSDPQAFRARFGHGQPADVPPQPLMTPQIDPSRTPPGPRASMTPQPSHTPQATCTPRPQMTNTPQGQSYGPGSPSSAQPAATPVGQGDGHEYGPGPQATPSSGSGGGNGGPQQQTPPQSGGGNGSDSSGSGGNGSGSRGSGSGRP